MSFTVNDIITEAADLANISIGAAANVTSAQATQAFQRAYEQIAGKMHVFTNSVFVQLVEGQKRYVLPDAIQGIVEIRYDTAAAYPHFSNAAPWTFGAGASDKFYVSVNGGAAQTLTFVGAGVTASGLVTQINAQITGATAYVSNGAVIIANLQDLSGTLEVLAGANDCYTVLGVTEQEYLSTGSWPLRDIQWPAVGQYPPNSNSVPDAYAIVNRGEKTATNFYNLQLELFPSPSADAVGGTLIIYYTSYISDYITTDTVTLPLYYRNPLVFATASRLCIYDRNPAGVQQFKGMADDALSDAKTQDLANNLPDTIIGGAASRSQQDMLGTFFSPYRPWV